VAPVRQLHSSAPLVITPVYHQMLNAGGFPISVGAVLSDHRVALPAPKRTSAIVQRLAPMGYIDKTGNRRKWIRISIVLTRTSCPRRVCTARLLAIINTLRYAGMRLGT
jgi:hypothetical protein